jgi:hypothetical protein
MKLIVATLLAAAALSAAQAQTVYRCGNAYSQAPCPQAQAVDVSDPRSATQQADARRVADDERRLAAEMRRVRLADEGSARNSAAVSLSGARPTLLAAAPERPHKNRRLKLRAPAKSLEQPAAAGTSAKESLSTRRAQG